MKTLSTSSLRTKVNFTFSDPDVQTHQSPLVQANYLTFKNNSRKQSEKSTISNPHTKSLIFSLVFVIATSLNLVASWEIIQLVAPYLETSETAYMPPEEFNTMIVWGFAYCTAMVISIGYTTMKIVDFWVFHTEKMKPQ